MPIRSEKIRFWCVTAVLLCAGVWAGGPTKEQIRQATGDYLQKGTPETGIEKLSDYVSQRVRKTSRIPTREMGVLAVAANCIQFMELAGKCEMTTEFQRWILASDKRLHLFVEVIQPQDKLSEVVRILDVLRAHDAQGVDQFYDLALAVAVVMDKRVGRMHGQMGNDLLPYKPDPVERFDYFKELYASGKAKIDYRKLTVEELVFVVHVPVPMSEIEWARKHVDSSLGDWGDNYAEIEYNNVRLNASRYSWDQGTYTLEAISELGGICVDQAYYCVISARSFGIPSIYFHGAGNSGNHAWFAFMERPGEWHLGIGRYASNQYTTGYGIHPQTNRKMTDHDVEYTCERSRHSAELERAGAYLGIAEVLSRRDPESALKCAKDARMLVKRYLPAWELERRLLIRQKNYEELLEQFAQEKDAFRKYPYILADSAKEVSAALKKAGRIGEAEEVMKKLAAVVGDEQDDITYGFELEKIEQLIAEGNLKKARKEMEQMLEEPENRGNKGFGLIQKYISMTASSGQTNAAVKFLEDYVEDLVESYGFSPGYEIRLWRMMQTAYRNNGDEREAQEVEVTISRLEARQGG